MKLIVLCPHFEPDTAPTGVVVTRLVRELAALGHEVHVVTALPWYRAHQVEVGWEGRRTRREVTDFGSIARVYPFPARDKRNIARRALGFLAFCAVAGFTALRVGRRGGRVDAMFVMSPPLPIGLVGWAVARLRRAPVVFNVQDIFPDAAIATGAITGRRIIALSRLLERATYRAADAITVLSDDLVENVRAKVSPARRNRVHMIPNFVDTAAIQPRDRATAYRLELGIGDEPVVMYAGNLGMSQSLELLVEAARVFPEITFVFNGDGSGRAAVEQLAAGLQNVRFAPFQPVERLAEVLATADLHVVPLRRGLGSVSVPSKTYSILAAGRPILAAIDPGTEIPRILGVSGAGMWVEPDDPAAFVTALRGLVADRPALVARGAAGRRWVEGHVSPHAVACQYEELFRRIAAGRTRTPRISR